MGHLGASDCMTMSGPGKLSAATRLWRAAPASAQPSSRFPGNGRSPHPLVAAGWRGLPAPAPVESREAADWLAGHVEKLMEHHEDPRRQSQLFDHSPVPMVMVDGERRAVYANLPARLVLRYRLTSLQRLRIDDLTPARDRDKMEEAWHRLRGSGRAAGSYEIEAPRGSTLTVVYYACADAAPGLHLIAFVPAEWSPRDLHTDGAEAPASLTARELEVLELAAQGLTSQMIAARLVVSVTTVSTHFRNIYEKLGVRDRAAAVATALRLGLIV